MRNILCFGDSNTWGYNPSTKERFPQSIRWTGLLQKRLGEENANVIEEGLCGRTTIYEDQTRPGRKGIDSLPEILNRCGHLENVILMLGTNDCKAHNMSTPKDIAAGIDDCLDIILQYVSPKQVLLISPIHLGDDVWKDDYDPEFDIRSVKVSRGLENEYKKIARSRHVHFLAASKHVLPSKEDQEHLDAYSHTILADVIYNELKQCG